MSKENESDTVTVRRMYTLDEFFIILQMSLFSCYSKIYRDQGDVSVSLGGHVLTYDGHCLYQSENGVRIDETDISGMKEYEVKEYLDKLCARFKENVLPLSSTTSSKTPPDYVQLSIELSKRHWLRPDEEVEMYGYDALYPAVHPETRVSHGSPVYSQESFVHRTNDSIAFPLEAAPFPIREAELTENQVVVGSGAVCKQFKNNKTYRLTLVRTMPRSAIKSALNDVIKEAVSHPDLLYLFTTVGCGDGGWSVQEISSLFVKALWTRNIRLPKVFIDSIVAEVERDYRLRSDFTIDQLSELRKWKREEAFKNAKRKYGNVFSILPRENVSEFLDVIADAEAGIYYDGGDLNKTRETVRLIFFFLHDKGIIQSNPQDLCECGEEFNKTDIAPRHIKTFMYSVIGLVNPGSHVRPNKPKKLENTAFEDYRTALDGGKYKFLTQSLAYMVLNILEWCSTLETEKGKA